ncbi:MAG TPA: DUF116 domain-containing protein [Clostridia bacterium]|nr:DUF116 domain-containing protein [Clostridia bacterium]
MDKRLNSFMGYSFLLLAVIGAVAALFSYVYRFFSIDLYNRIISVLILLALIVMILVIASMIAIFTAIKSRRVRSFMLVPVRMGLRLVIPFALFVTDLLKKDKDMIRSLFIDINNLFVQSGKIQKSPDKIMLLLPHCLQNSECGLKITGNISNCKNCGRCTIGAIRELAEEKGVRAVVVTGGTAARNAIAREKPEIVLSVACERDLAIGISDVSKIPVIGVLNRRPNGPCINTTVDVELLREKLDSILLREEGSQTGSGTRNCAENSL